MQRPVMMTTPRLCGLVLGVFLTFFLVPEVRTGMPFPLVSYDRRSPTLLRFPPRYPCSRVEVRIKLPVPGCGAVYLRTHACRGHCRSVSFPEWAAYSESMHTVRFCYCCKPTTTETIKGMVVDCPGGGRYRLNMKAARECHCRPCSDGNPNHEQPYDY